MSGISLNVDMISQITAIMMGIAFGAMSALVAVAIKRYLTVSWRSIRSEK